MSKRLFHKADIADLMREASTNDMRVIVRPSGEIEIFPAIHSPRASNVVDLSPQAKADASLADWKVKNDSRQNARRS
jgi:hypothetical protein